MSADFNEDYSGAGPDGGMVPYRAPSWYLGIMPGDHTAAFMERHFPVGGSGVGSAAVIRVERRRVKPVAPHAPLVRDRRQSRRFRTESAVSSDAVEFQPVIPADDGSGVIAAIQNLVSTFGENPHSDEFDIAALTAPAPSDCVPIELYDGAAGDRRGRADRATDRRKAEAAAIMSAEDFLFQPA